MQGPEIFQFLKYAIFTFISVWLLKPRAHCSYVSNSISNNLYLDVLPIQRAHIIVNLNKKYYCENIE